MRPSRSRQGSGEDPAVLDEWAEFHDAVLGYPPNW